MRQKIKKNLLLLVCFVACIGTWANIFDVDGITYQTQDTPGTVKVSDGRYYRGDRDLVIPETVSDGSNTYTVTSIGGSAFYGSNSLTSVVIPNSVTTISDRAFQDCESLKTVTLSKSLSRIGHSAFKKCTSLSSIFIPKSVVSIGNNVFDYCSSLTSITIEKGNSHYDSRDNCNAIIETSTNSLIRGCVATVIPNSVTAIKYHAFSGCLPLVSITIPNSVKSIGAYAFKDCSSLASITIPSSVTRIDNHVFQNCTSLATITFPNSVALIGEGVFWQCSSLKSVILPESLEIISKELFWSCSSLTSVAIPSSVKEIETGAFSYCESLDSIIIPNTVTKMYNVVFMGCSSLASITLPNSIKYIGNGAFWYCSNLSKIYSKIENPKSVNSEMFGDRIYNTCTLYIPKTTTDLYKSANPWCNFKNIEEFDYEATGIENVYKDDMKIAVNGGNLEVEGAKGEMVEVYRMDGKMIYCGKDTSIPVGKGTYIVRVANQSFKVSR